MNNTIIEKISITDFASEGKSIAKIEGKVIFVENAVPGDVVDLEIIKNKKRLSFGKAIHFHQYSEKRTQPFCNHFGVCGGCKWQHIDYSEQLKYKQQEVIDALTRIGKIDIGEILPIIGCDEIKFYRNKLDFTFSTHRWLTEDEIKSGKVIENKNAIGFHLPENFRKIIDIQQCLLQDDLSNQIRNAVRIFAAENNLTFYDVTKHEGILRNLIIRNTTLDEWMVIISFANAESEKVKPLLDYLKNNFPKITSLHYVFNPKRNDTIFDLDIATYHGRGFIYETLGNLKFKISPKSFFQTNTKQAEKLYSAVKKFASLKGGEIIYDLYTGTGSIALFLADKCKKIIGIEQVAAAIEDAKFNAGLNNILNAVFFTGDMKDIFNDNFISENGIPDLIITDPPRNGMHKDVVGKILQIAPEKIIYVSCNPATQARDLEMMKEKYSLEEIQTVDMFPHTHHIENVALLQLRK